MDVYDRYLAGRVKRGDHRAFARLYDRHSTRVYNLLRRLTADTQTAEDLTQETFVQSWQSLDKWQGRGKFSTYLCGIAVNLYRAHRRQHATRESATDMLGDTLPDDSGATDPLHIINRQEALAVLDEAIANLPPECREVFVLVRVEELAYREAADLLQIPLGTVQSRLARATRLLRTELTEYFERSQPCPTASTNN